MLSPGDCSRQLLLLFCTCLVVVEFDVAISAKRAFLDEFSFFPHDVLDGDARI
jgi:hypothetical protein